MSRNIRVNDRIRAKEIRVIGVQGEQIGVMSPQEALQHADAAGLDLVEVAPTANPPVCRIIDFGKYLYGLNKKEKEAKKKQKIIAVKEIKLSPKIDDHDYQIKRRNAIGFLSRGDKVKVTLFFRGRELDHVYLGRQLLQRFISDLEDVAQVERNTGLEGKLIVAILRPKGSRKSPGGV